MATVEDLHKICGHDNFTGRKIAFLSTIKNYAPELMAPHRMAQLLSQICHESTGFRHAKEVWGPTTAQLRYEGRKDLGNVRPGDGKLFMGRDLIQITGRANYRTLTKWIRSKFGPQMPDFEATPGVLEEPGFLGLGVLWYWKNRVPARFVEDGNIEMVTRRVNGGLNGYQDRLRYFDRAALVLLGYEPDDIEGFQTHASLVVDGISGPKTRAAMHGRLFNRPAPKLVSEKHPSFFSAVLKALTALFGGKS